MDYATKRTPGRILILICVIWVTSIVISGSHLFPIFRDKRGRPSDQCHLIGNVPYTIISTVGAFYIPLIVMCIIYWKIFQAAKFRIRRKAFNANRSCAPVASTFGTNATAQYAHGTAPTSQTATPNHELPLIKQQTKYQSFSPPQTKKNSRKKSDLANHRSSEIELDNVSSYSSSASQHNNDYQLKPLKKGSYSLIKKKRTSLITATTSAPAIQLSTTNPLKQEDEDELQPINVGPVTSSTHRLIASPFHLGSSNAINTIHNPLITSNSSPSNSSHVTDTPTIKPLSTTVFTNINNNNSHSNTTIVTKSPGLMSRKKIDIKRERKATKVLGVVMGCFILCWLPFFLEETICGILRKTLNEKITSVLTWLGYLNSLLNPVIYTIFSPDFRQAFGKILFGKYRKRRRRLKK